MDQDGSHAGMHTPHDSGLCIESAVKGREQELEEEVRFLAEKVNNASQRSADYENEIRVLQAQLRQQQRRNGDSTSDAALATPVPEKPTLSRFGSLMHVRKASPASNGVPGNAREKELESELVKERTQRITAEKKIKSLEAEVEELSATLFQEANEMVSTARQETAALQDKLHDMERQAAEQDAAGDMEAMQAIHQENVKLRERIKILEQRDSDRRRRLEKLDAANKRVDRVRTLLIPR